MGETLVEVKPQKKSGCGAFQIGFLVFIVVALAIGLAVGFTLKPSSDSNTANVQSSTSNKTAPAAAGSNPNKPSRPAMYEKLVPPEGQIYTGFHLDWSSEKPTTIVSFLNGRKPAIL